MNRRAGIRAALAPPLAIFGLLLGAAAPANASTAARLIPAAVATAPEPPPTPITVNEFIPEEENISDCLGALERPGCGSKARGGWRQTMVFVVMLVGVAVVFTRVGLGVYRSRNRSAGVP